MQQRNFLHWISERLGKTALARMGFTDALATDAAFYGRGEGRQEGRIDGQRGGFRGGRSGGIVRLRSLDSTVPVTHPLPFPENHI